MSQVVTGILVATLGLASIAGAAPAPRAVPRPVTQPAKKVPPPTMANIQEAFEAKDYPGTLQLIQRVPSAKDPAAEAYDRYEVLMLKGEAHLQLRQLKAAGDAFAAAAKETDDQTKAAVARATQRLLRDAKGTKIQRKTPAKGGAGPTAVGLLDREKRGDAFAIAYEDARAAVEPAVKTALRARTLPPIAKGLELLDGLGDLEIAATGGATSNDATRQDLGARATSLIEKELDRIEGEVNDIRASASEVVEEVIYEPLFGDGGSSSVHSVRRGLSKRDRADLEAAITTCSKIIPTAESLARATHANPGEADALVDRAKELGRGAERALKAEY